MADFQLHKAAFDANDTEVIALSAEDEGDARALVDQLGIEFPVLYGLDADAMSGTVGTYTGLRQDRRFTQPAAFVLNHDGIVEHAVYSSGKVGRLTAHDVLALLPKEPVEQSAPR